VRNCGPLEQKGMCGMRESSAQTILVGENMEDSILDRVSYHAVYDVSILEAMRYAKGNGFSGVQIADETPHLSFERLSTEGIDEIAKYSGDEGVNLTLHAPDDAASLFQSSRYLATGVLNYYRALFTFARAVGSRLVTIHLGHMTVFGADDETGREIPPEDMSPYASSLKRNIEAVLGMADGKAMVCVENYGLGEAEVSLLKPYLGHDNLFLCWDLVKSPAAQVWKRSTVLIQSGSSRCICMTGDKLPQVPPRAIA